VPSQNESWVVPTASVAVAFREIVPETVDPLVGAVMLTTGFTVSAAALAELPGAVATIGTRRRAASAPMIVARAVSRRIAIPLFRRSRKSPRTGVSLGRAASSARAPDGDRS
jgi:hypothetical protein